MTINTKYNVGDKVWFLYDNKAYLSKIQKITYDETVMYHFKDPDFASLFTSFEEDIKKESEVFPTKQALLEYL